MAILTASQVPFSDDTCTARGANRELDAKDVFFLSRLNDPSTYFFHWYVADLTEVQQETSR
jgi:hypothetical protein